MLGKVVVVAGAGAVAWLLRSRAGSPGGSSRSGGRFGLPGRGGAGTTPQLVDRRPEALESARTAPALLPDATATEIAGAVLPGQSLPH